MNPQYLPQIYADETPKPHYQREPVNNKRDALHKHIPLLLSCNPYRAAK